MASMKREILLFLSLLLIGSAFGQTITTAQPDSACVQRKCIGWLIMQGVPISGLSRAIVV